MIGGVGPAPGVNACSPAPTQVDFQSLADNLPALCWTAAADGSLVWVNRRWRDYSGLPPEQLMGCDWISLVPPEHRASVLERWRASVATERPFETTLKLMGADGVVRPFLTRAEPHHAPDGAVTRWFGVNTEVSESTRTKAALRSERDRYRHVLDDMGEGFALLDHELRILDINAEGMRSETRPREAVLGRTHMEAYPNADPALAEVYARVLATQRPESLLHDYEWAPGKPSALRMRAFPVEEGLAVFFRDMSDERRAELDLQETSRRLDAILNNTTMAVFLMDERQHCAYANPAAETLTGYSFAEMRGRPLHDVVHHKKPDGSHYPLEECPIDRAFPERAQMQGRELFVARDGSFYPVEFTASPVLDDDGRPIGTVIEARNIAADLARETALRETEERYRLAARATNDAVWDWHFATNTVLWNEALQEAYGHAPEDVGPTGDWWIKHIHPDDQARVDASIHAAIDGDAHR